jgi:hypothetical protein
MPSPQYFREQAELLRAMASATHDCDYAAQLEARALLYLNQAELPDQPMSELNYLFDAFNQQQMRGFRTKQSSTL